MSNRSLARVALTLSLLAFVLFSLAACSSRPRSEPTSSSSQSPSEGSMIPSPAPPPEKPPPDGAEPPPIFRRRLPRPPIPQSPAPAPTDDELLQQALARMKHGNLAYNTPDKMKTGQVGHVVARIGTDLVPLHDLEAGMPTTANTQTATAPTPVSTKMKMTLTSADFDITSLSSQEQWVAGDAPTTWEWDITPKHSGKLSLHLAAVVELNGLSKDFKTVDKDIAVDVDPVDAVTKFAKENTVWILGILGTAIAALFAWWKKRTKPDLSS